MSFLAGLIVCMALVTAGAEAPDIRVNGEPVSAEAWRFLLLTRGLPDDATAEQLQPVRQQLIDRTLIRGFLAQRQVVAPPDLLDLRVYELDELIRRRGDDPAQLYARVGLSSEQVRQELALGAAWETFIEQTVTAEQVREHFAKHRAELDGTRVRVRQIFRKGTAPAERATAATLLTQVRGDVASGRTTFEAAAKEFSQAPSREQGGDLGWIAGQGQLPVEVSRAALALQAGKISEPIVSPVGTHLVTITERQPGQLSLEDARPQVLEQLAQVRWLETVAQLRRTARVEDPAK